MEWLVTRKLDVGLVSSDIDNPYLTGEPLMEHPVVCIMPPGHALSAESLVQPADLDEVPFVSFDPENFSAQRIYAIFMERRLRLNVVMVANLAQTLCEFVAAGHGVSLVHPLMAKEFGKRLVVRPFEPASPLGFRLCRTRESRNDRLIEDFADVTRETARRA